MGSGLLSTLNIASIAGFLAGLAYLVWRDRENIERHAIVLVRRTEWGIPFLDRVARRYDRIWRWWARLGVVVALVGIPVVLLLILQQTLRLFLVADAAPAVSPIVPTVSTVTNPAQAGYLGLPFWHFVIGLSVVLFVHEGMHGIIARVEGFELESVGLLLLAIIPGAFVKPEGQEDFFESDTSGTNPWDQGTAWQQLRVFAAGPFANLTVAALLGLVMLGGFTLAHGPPELRGVYAHDGMEIVRVQNGTAADAAGLERGMVITAIGGNATPDLPRFRRATQDLRVGQALTVRTKGNGSFTVTLRERPAPNLTYRPAPIDPVLVALEKELPGTIRTYATYNDLLVDGGPQVRIARWQWVAAHHPSLQDRARQRIAALRADIPSEGYMGVFVVPARHVKDGMGPVRDVLFPLFQVVFFVMLLNIAIGSANLLPVKGLDGGWLVYIFLDEYAPAHADRVSRTVTAATLFLILISLGYLLIGFL